MHLLFFSFLTLLTSATHANSAGCSQASTQAPGTNKNYTIQIGTNQRSYTVFLPSSYNISNPNPLILSYHGNGKSALQQETLDQLSNPLFNTDHIVVYPQGFLNHWQPGPYAISNASDLDFTAALLPHLQNTFCINSNRIYATGKSVGGGFVSALACDPHLGPQFAAFASVSGAYYWDTPSNHTACDPGLRAPSNQAPMLEFHGVNDTTIPYDGGWHQGVDLPNVGMWAGWWKVRNGCSADQGPNVIKSFGGNVERIVYGGCAVEHWKIAGLGHAWPSTLPNSDNSQGTYVNATPVIVDWFRGHSLGSSLIG